MNFKEMILDMVEHYSKNARGVSPEDGGCVYVANQYDNLLLNNMCQMGRCFVPDVQQAFRDNPDLNQDTAVSELAQTFNMDFDDLFVPEYQGHTIDQWRVLQGLHDEHHNWCDTDDGHALTSRGIAEMLANCSTLTAEELLNVA